METVRCSSVLVLRQPTAVLHNDSAGFFFLCCYSDDFFFFLKEGTLCIFAMYQNSVVSTKHHQWVAKYLTSSKDFAKWTVYAKG